MGPTWAPCWPHEPCYLGTYLIITILLQGHLQTSSTKTSQNLYNSYLIWRHWNYIVYDICATLLHFHMVVLPYTLNQKLPHTNLKPSHPSHCIKTVSISFVCISIFCNLLKCSNGWGHLNSVFINQLCMKNNSSLCPSDTIGCHIISYVWRTIAHCALLIL